MQRISNLIILVLMAVTLFSCHRNITLTILNQTKENITIEYRKPGSANEEFYVSPKTYTYNHKFSNFKKYSRQVKEEPTIYTPVNDTTIKVILEPGKVLIIGKYNASKNREELVRRYNLKLDIRSASTKGFESWENFRNEVLTVR